MSAKLHPDAMSQSPECLPNHVLLEVVDLVTLVGHRITPRRCPLRAPSTVLMCPHTLSPAKGAMLELTQKITSYNCETHQTATTLFQRHAEQHWSDCALVPAAAQIDVLVS